MLAPMGLWQRFLMLFRARASSALDRAEDPRQTIDYAYNRQLELLQQMRRGVADVATARKRIELQANQLQQTSAKLEGQARQALTQNREDLAREALGRRAAIQSELVDLRAQHDQLQQEENRMLEGTRLLEDRVAQFRRQKETVKASYTAAEARTRVGESMAGLSKEMSELGLAMQRAEDRIAQTHARAAAIEELMASGQLENLAAPGDRIQAELNVTAQSAQVDTDLARLKRELGSAPPPPALEEPKPSGQP
jgi:phage shock protein A